MSTTSRIQGSLSLYLFLLAPGDHFTLPSFPTRRSSDLEYRRTIDVARRLGCRWVRPAPREKGRPDLKILATFLAGRRPHRSEEHTSELQSPYDLVCRLLLEKKKKTKPQYARRCRLSTFR